MKKHAQYYTFSTCSVGSILLSASLCEVCSELPPSTQLQLTSVQQEHASESAWRLVRCRRLSSYIFAV
jgi:hypothetical protein